MYNTHSVLHCSVFIKRRLFHTEPICPPAGTGHSCPMITIILIILIIIILITIILTILMVIRILRKIMCVLKKDTGCFCFTGPPLKSSKYRKVDLG